MHHFEEFSRKRLLRFIIYVVTILCSVAFLFFGNRLTSKDAAGVLSTTATIQPEKAAVNMILDRNTESYDLGGTIIENVTIRFVARIASGAQQGSDVMVVQSVDGYMPTGLKEVEVGDKVLVALNPDDPAANTWMFVEYLRTDMLLVMGLIFALLLLLFGGIKGFNTLLSLAFTCSAVFLVFIPSILAGYNIYLSSVIICLFIIVMTLMIINGPNKKTLTAILGCFGGVLLSGVIAVTMDSFLKLTGYTDEDSAFLALLETPTPIDLKAIIFGAIIIGAMGAIMDVAMSIASSLQEVSQEAKNPTFSTLLRSGFSIGRDMMGTMSNTLILAYIGSSLSVVLLLIVYSPSILHLLNREMIIVEILQALVGSLGILFTIPFTSLLCAAMYSKKGRTPLTVLTDNNPKQ
ncbi:MAG: YibE/F family protein [Acetanaerobacterium sp.]